MDEFFNNINAFLNHNAATIADFIPIQKINMTRTKRITYCFPRFFVNFKFLNT